MLIRIAREKKFGPIPLLRPACLGRAQRDSPIVPFCMPGILTVNGIPLLMKRTGAIVMKAKRCDNGGLEPVPVEGTITALNEDCTGKWQFRFTLLGTPYTIEASEASAVR